MNIKILAEDKLFSQFIRRRDRKCVRCGSSVRFNEKGEAISHSVSHYLTRGNWAVRFDEENCITLCFPCHQRWGGDEREEFKKFMAGWLGRSAFGSLMARSNGYANKTKVREWAKA